MKHRIKTKYLIRMITFLIIAIGAMILAYDLFAKDFFVYATKNNMEDYFGEIKRMQFEKLTSEEKDELDDIVSRGYRVKIYDGTKMIYASDDNNPYINHKNNFFVQDMDEYQYEGSIRIKNDSLITLKGKVKQKNTIYYIRIGMSIRMLDSSIIMNSKFLFIEMIIIIILGVFYSIYLADKTLKPVEQLDKITKKMMENSYTGEEEYSFDDDEIGQLAKRVQNMYVQISGNLIEEKNYNYLLKMQNAALAEMDTRKQNFIQTATHELKTPLAIISGQIEMMHLDHTDEMSEYYDSIMEEIEKMSVLIRDMLNSSFNEQLESDIKLERQNLSEILMKQQDKYVLWMKRKKLMCRYDVEPDIYICMNRDQIEQAFNNFMMNAYEYAAPNSCVDISLKNIDGFAYFSVHNKGKKISKENFDRIWEKFYSEKKSDDNSNAGLGLYIVYHIVKYHNGECFFENTEDGVTFTIKLKIEE